jgi:nucleotide-binding universal stress UspA family protein
MITPIVAGTDGSEESLAAVEWAARAAGRRRMPLCIVHVVEHYHGHATAQAQPIRRDRTGRFRHDLPHRARSVLARARRRAAEAAPGVELRTAAIFGHADQVFAALTVTAPLVAVGMRGTGGPGPRLGSVALSLACHASCPVVFAPVGTSPVLDEIVVGIEDCDHAMAALEFGFGEADVRGSRLTALHVWTRPQAGQLDAYHDWILSIDPVNEGAATLLSEQVAPWRDKYPGVIVTESTVHGHPGRVLAMASRGADLIVVGGRRGEIGPVPGSDPVHYILHRTQCPIALIPGGAPTVGSLGTLALTGDDLWP